jgi:hypothetical protein
MEAVITIIVIFLGVFLFSFGTVIQYRIKVTLHGGNLPQRAVLG